MNETDENKVYDKLKDEGYKSREDYIFQKSFERATRDYERKMNDPYKYCRNSF